MEIKAEEVRVSKRVVGGSYREDADARRAVAFVGGRKSRVVVAYRIRARKCRTMWAGIGPKPILVEIEAEVMLGGGGL